MTTNEQRELLQQFLQRWTIENVENMTLEEYVGIGNPDTFCQWVETKTRLLGSIKGMTSIKFGIYERENPIQKPKNYFNDDRYSWLRCYGDNRETAYSNVKQDIVKTIQLSQVGKFDQIDAILLPNLFKWKVAFLYSNERLIPYFKKDVLIEIANYYGLKTDKHTTISEIQNVMMENKPAYLSVFEFSKELDEKSKQKNGTLPAIGKRKDKKHVHRKPSSVINTQPQTRTILPSIINPKTIHSNIQKTLKKRLIEQYGIDNVSSEENFVDIKVVHPDKITFYEVKSHSYASDCIKEALGQLLLYSFRDDNPKPKKHIVVGQNQATSEDRKFICFLKNILRVEFDYKGIEDDDID